MVKVAGKPIISHQIEAFKNAGVKNIIIVVGYEADKIVDHCNAFTDITFEFFHNIDYEFNNNMYSMYLLNERLKGKEFVFCNADVVYDSNIISKLVYSVEGDYIVVDKDTYDEESMKVRLHDSGFISTISKYLNSNEAFGRSVDLYRITPESSYEFFNLIQKTIEIEQKTKEWTEVAIDTLAKDGRVLFKPLDIHGLPWVEIDNYEDLQKADYTFSNYSFFKYKAFFIDIDGTIALGDEILEGAKEFILFLQESGTDYYFVTNNSSKSKVDYVNKLDKLGISVTTEHIILSTDGLIQTLIRKNINKVYCIGTESMKEELSNYRIYHTEENPQYVVLGYDNELTYQKLVDACKWINRGIRYSATHMDIFCPTKNGPIPDIGTLISMIEMTTGKSPEHVHGKPNTTMLSHLVGDKYLPIECAFIGDRLYTDKLLADRLGMDFICVLTGETKREDLQNYTNNWPKYIVSDLRSLVHNSVENAKVIV